MMKLIKTILLLLALLCAKTSFAQSSIADLWVPDVSIKRKAKENAKVYLLGVKDSLELTKRQVKVRNFKLDQTSLFYEVVNDKDLLDEIDVPDGIAIYTYRHRINGRGSGYVTNFEFDYLGNILFVKTYWFLVSY